jgi:hypothetical protein
MVVLLLLLVQLEVLLRPRLLRWLRCGVPAA